MENKKEYAIDLHRMIGKVYYEIASWNNEGGTDEEKAKKLKIVSQEIIEMILSDVFEPLDVQTKIQTMPGNDYGKKKMNVFNKIFKK